MSNSMSSPSPNDTVQRGASAAFAGDGDTFEPSKAQFVWNGQGAELAAAGDDAPDSEDEDELDDQDDDELDEDDDEDDDEEEDDEDEEAEPSQ